MTDEERQKLRFAAAAILELLGDLKSEVDPHPVVAGWLCVGTMVLRQFNELGVFEGIANSSEMVSEYDRISAHALIEHEAANFRAMAGESPC